MNNLQKGPEIIHWQFSMAQGYPVVQVNLIPEKICRTGAKAPENLLPQLRAQPVKALPFARIEPLAYSSIAGGECKQVPILGLHGR